MKKIMLTAATVATLLSTTAYGAEDMFYVKANVGWDKMDKIQGMKSNNDVFFGLGVGYYAMDNVRVDLTFDHYVNPTHKGSGIDEDTEHKINVKFKSRADSLMINGFVDLFDVSVAKIFAGAGVGMSMISAKYTSTDTVMNQSQTNKLKKKNNFAYGLHLGASTEFAPGVNGELTYSYRDMGKFKGGEDVKTSNLKGHHVAVGVRFDI